MWWLIGGIVLGIILGGMAFFRLVLSIELENSNLPFMNSEGDLELIPDTLGDEVVRQEIARAEVQALILVIASGTTLIASAVWGVILFFRWLLQ